MRLGQVLLTVVRAENFSLDLFHLLLFLALRRIVPRVVPVIWRVINGTTIFNYLTITIVLLIYVFEDVFMAIWTFLYLPIERADQAERL